MVFFGTREIGASKHRSYSASARFEHYYYGLTALTLRPAYVSEFRPSTPYVSTPSQRAGAPQQALSRTNAAIAPGVVQCLQGLVWRRANATDHVCVTPESRARVAQENATAASRVNRKGAYGPNTCIGGYVWREAFNGDVVCVTAEVRAMVRQENLGIVGAPR